MAIKAECTWGDGPDVLVKIDSADVSKWAIVISIENGSATFGLNADQARKLAADLVSAANCADRLEDQAFEDSK